MNGQTLYKSQYNHIFLDSGSIVYYKDVRQLRSSSTFLFHLKMCTELLKSVFYARILRRTFF